MTPNHNFALLVGRLAAAPSPHASGGRRGMTVTVVTEEPEGEVAHRVVVEDELLASALHASLSPGAVVQAAGRLAYDGAGAYLRIEAGARGSDLRALGAHAAAGPAAPRAAAAAPPPVAAYSASPAPRSQAAPAPSGDLSDLSSLESLESLPDDGPGQDEGEAVQRPAPQRAALPAQPAPVPRAAQPSGAPAPRTAPAPGQRAAPAPRLLPGARPTAAPALPPNAIVQPAPTAPPLQPARSQAPQRRDGFTSQADDMEIPF